MGEVLPSKGIKEDRDDKRISSSRMPFKVDGRISFVLDSPVDSIPLKVGQGTKDSSDE